MTKIISLCLSLLLSLYSFCLDDAKALQGVLDSFGLPYAFAARGIAYTVRRLEKKYEKQPEEAEATSKTVADDTGADFVTQPEQTLYAEAWKAVEVSFESDRDYADAFSDADVELVLVGNGVKLTVPAFWDGARIWKARFVCPSEGEWLFRTFCTDGDNTGLHGRTGKVICRAYTGDMEIYRHGFVTTATGKKYLTYSDGTPFFYLGDTHWSLGDETQQMVKTICAQRVRQGFTVWQSEPIGAGFDFTNGITEDDMAGLADYDAKFKTIADAGLVHANAEFFFPPYMNTLLQNFGGFSEDGQVSDGAKRYLEKISRYWVARYGAYPVIWTLGQEADDDFYYPNQQAVWSRENNPYKLVAQYIGRYDAYAHPLTAHQENAGDTTAYGNGNGVDEKRTVYRDSKPSAFRSVDEHTLYAAQWSPSLTKKSDSSVEKDYWYNSQGKPVINYEGRYCYLWTKDFGSRMQGWAAYLSGMYGYGWGAHDTWSYLNTYNEDEDSSDGVDTITAEEKQNATWEDALEYPSSYQVGYMKSFFEKMKWWELIPRFDDPLYFIRSAGVTAFVASNADHSEAVIYFYNFSDESIGQKPNSNAFSAALTGTIASLEPSAEYKFRWFDPSTGRFSQEESFVSTPLGTYSIGERRFGSKSVTGDIVFYMTKA